MYNFTAQAAAGAGVSGGQAGVRAAPACRKFRAYCRQQVDTLWDEVKRFDNPHSYYVDLSDRLWNIQQDLLRNR